MRVYIAGPYRGEDAFAVRRNIEQAREALVKLIRSGHAPFCPHTHTAHLEHYAPDLPDERYLAIDLEYLAVCAAIVMLPGWRDSAGACEERRLAEEWGLQVYESVEEVPPAQ